MNFLLFQPPVKNIKDRTVDHLLTPVYDPLYSTNEDSEFSEDIHQAKDQLFMYTEDCIAAGCPEDLW